MQSILEHEAVRLVGALSVSRWESGIMPRRLPEWALAQIADPMFRWVVSNASGVRLVFSTDSDVVEIEAKLTGAEIEGTAQPPAPRFDLVIDGEVRATQTTTAGALWVLSANDRNASPTLRDGDAGTIRFDGLGGAMKRVEVWLPQARRVELRDLRIDDGAALAAAAPLPVRWVHYGSSISHCAEADGPTATWPAVAARAADVELTSLGFAGQCHLDQCVARTIRDLPADVISAKLGINVINGDSMRERAFQPALHGFIDTVRDGHPRTPLLLITPILYPAGEDHPGPSILRRGVSAVVDRPDELAFGALTIGRVREIMAVVVDQRRRAGDANVHLLDGRTLFGEGDLGDLPDGLHPNTAGYRRMGERFAATAFGAGGVLR